MTTNNDGAIQVNTATSGAVSKDNYLSSIVIDSDNIGTVTWTYAGFVYVGAIDRSNMSRVSGNLKLRIFYETLIKPSIGKRGNHFDHDLSKNELKYLCDSNDIRLKMVYIRIMESSILNNIPLRYTDETIKNGLLEMYSIHGNFNSNYLDDLSIENQIRIYNDNPYLPKSKFISFIEWFNNPENNEKKYPMQKKDIIDDYDLGVYLQQIKSIRYSKDNKPYFGVILTYEQLKYLHESKDKRLHDLYVEILNKALDNNIDLQYAERGSLNESRYI